MVSRESVIFESDDGENGGEPGRADGHGLSRGEAIGKWNQPVGFDPRLLSESAPVAFTNAPTGEDDFVSCPIAGIIGRFNDAGEVDSGNVREVPDNSAVGCHAQTIFVVDGGVFDFDGDVAFRELRFVQLAHRDTRVSRIVFLTRTALNDMIDEGVIRPGSFHEERLP